MVAAAAASSSDDIIFDAAISWNFNSYAAYSFSVNYVELEALYHPNSPSFTTILDVS